MSDDSQCSGVSFFDPQSLRWLQHPLVDMEEISLRQSMIETISSEMELIDTLQNGSGMLRGLPGESRQAADSTGVRRFSASKLFTVCGDVSGTPQ